MIERHRRERTFDQRPPSRHMRSLLRRAYFGIHELKREFEIQRPLKLHEERLLRWVLHLCRRATARDPRPDWFVPLTLTTPATTDEALAALDRLVVPIRALDATWRRRLVAAGIDPNWSDA